MSAAERGEQLRCVGWEAKAAVDKSWPSREELAALDNPSAREVAMLMFLSELVDELKSLKNEVSELRDVVASLKGEKEDDRW
jgi:hypothetical protein